MRIITLNLDRNYEMRFSTMALLKLERELGMPIVEAFQAIKTGEQKFDLETIFKIVRCGVKDFAEKSIEDIAELVDEHGPGETTMEKFGHLFKTTVEAMNESMVGDEKKRKATMAMMAELARKTASTGESMNDTPPPSGSPPSSSAN